MSSAGSSEYGAVIIALPTSAIPQTVSLFALSLSLGDLSAVDGNNRAMQERSVIGSEKQADGGDLIRFRDPAPRLICVLNTSAI